LAGVKPQRQRASGAALIAGLVALCVVLWLLYGAIGPAPSQPVAAEPVPVAARAAPAVVLPSPVQQPTLPEPPRGEPPELRGQDSIDPCTVGFEPAIPPGFETATSDSVTVAWQPGAVVKTGPYDVAVQPTAIAYLIHGLLAEAAALTGTLPRDRLTVIVYPSPAALRAATRAPAWAGGVYDGGAVRIPASPGDDLGIELAPLRHELMHAQLHAAVGCMPSWFNEGLAMYFAGSPPVRPWIRMLRTPDSYDLRGLHVPTFARMADDSAERAYAESLAMIVFLVDRSGETGLRTAVQTLRASAADPPRAALELWDRIAPGAGHHDVLDALAHKVLGVTARADVDRALQGVVCCSGVRAVADLRCHGAPVRPERRRWIDPASTPRAVCDSSW
jgi:hypothetical protein